MSGSFDRWDHKAAYAALGADQKHTALAANLLLRDRFAEAQNWRCCYCGVQMNRWRDGPTLCTIEHVIPASAGGRVCWETCAAACKKCNTMDGLRLKREWMLPLTVRLCGWCGSDQVRVVGNRAYKCGTCQRQYAIHGCGSGPLAPVLFGSLRRAAGEMIVANADVIRVADRLRRKIINVNFMPTVFAATLMELVAPVIAAARLRSDCQVEIYNTTIGVLRDCYTAQKLKGPERGLPSKGTIELPNCNTSFSFQLSNGIAEHPKDGQYGHDPQGGK